jgi:hypothetical protein
MKQSCFETKLMNVKKLNNDQIKQIRSYLANKDSVFICYQDTLDNSDTVRIAFKLKKHNQWISFPTQFRNSSIDYQLIDFDKDGQPELIINGDVVYETWPRGQNSNKAIVIFRMDSIPVQIFKLTCSCSTYNLGGKYQDHPVDFTIKREIIISNDVLTIGKLKPNTLDKDDKITYTKFCHLTDVDPGTFKLVNGKFVKQ